MPKKPLTAEVAENLATLAVNGHLLSLHVDKYKTGKNKGKHFADYTEGERTLPLDSINVLNALSLAFRQETFQDVEITMPVGKPMYASVTSQ